MANTLDITITQGATWADAKFWHSEDLSLGIPRGQIRSDYLDRGGEIYATFEFYPLTYGMVTLPNSATLVERTLIFPKLSGVVTGQIPIGRSTWVYDIFVRLGNRDLMISSGKAIVIPRVTEG